jgi:hypothetical protein
MKRPRSTLQAVVASAGIIRRAQPVSEKVPTRWNSWDSAPALCPASFRGAAHVARSPRREKIIAVSRATYRCGPSAVLQAGSSGRSPSFIDFSRRGWPAGTEQRTGCQNKFEERGLVLCTEPFEGIQLTARRKPCGGKAMRERRTKFCSGDW